MPEDFVIQLLTALLAIADEDADLRTITSRTDGIAVPWQPVTPEQPLPVLLVSLVDLTPRAGIMDTRQAMVQWTARAEGDDAILVCNRMLQRLELILTHTNLVAKGLDASPTGVWPRYGGASGFRRPDGSRTALDREGIRNVDEAHLDTRFLMTVAA